MSQFNLVTAWRRHAAGQAAQAMAFWRTHALAEPQEVEDLVPGLCALACEGASVVGVATVSFRQHAVMAGEPLPAVSKMLGHANIQNTARYAHLDDAVVIAAAEKVGAIIGELIGAEGACQGRPQL